MPRQSMCVQLSDVTVFSEQSVSQSVIIQLSKKWVSKILKYCTQASLLLSNKYCSHMFIHTSHCCCRPPLQFLSVEDPVRRRCRMISLTDPSVVVRGFQLLPLIVDFGTVQEGSSSVISVAMKNVGVDTCRYG